MNNHRFLVSLHGVTLHHFSHLLATHQRCLLHHLPQLGYYFWTFDGRVLGAGGGFCGKCSLCSQTTCGTYPHDIYIAYPVPRYPMLSEESLEKLIHVQSCLGRWCFGLCDVFGWVVYPFSYLACHCRFSHSDSCRGLE